jgi:hypothetical protein
MEARLELSPINQVPLTMSVINDKLGANKSYDAHSISI